MSSYSRGLERGGVLNRNGMRDPNYLHLLESCQSEPRMPKTL